MLNLRIVFFTFCLIILIIIFEIWDCSYVNVLCWINCIKIDEMVDFVLLNWFVSVMVNLIWFGMILFVNFYSCIGLFFILSSLTIFPFSHLQPPQEPSLSLHSPPLLSHSVYYTPYKPSKYTNQQFLDVSDEYFYQ